MCNLYLSLPCWMIWCPPIHVLVILKNLIWSFSLCSSFHHEFSASLLWLYQCCSISMVSSGSLPQSSRFRMRTQTPWVNCSEIVMFLILLVLFCGNDLWAVHSEYYYYIQSRWMEYWFCSFLYFQMFDDSTATLSRIWGDGRDVLLLH